MGKDCRDIERGHCRKGECDCTEFLLKATNAFCGYCDHAPSIHTNLGVAADIASGKNDSNVAGPSDPMLQSEPKSCIVDSANGATVETVANEDLKANLQSSKSGENQGLVLDLLRTHFSHRL